MENMDDLVNLMLAGQQLDTRNRALRLRISFPDGISDRVLLPQRVTGTESMCGGIKYTILCVAASIGLPLKGFIGLAAELQFVTDTGELHGVCGLVTEAASGQSDGGLATYQLVLRDVFSSVMALGANTRVFIDKNELEIAAIVLAGWRERSPLLAAAFDYKLPIELAQQPFPQRAFTRQDNESDAAFLTRLFKRRGIAWYVRPGRAMPTEDDDGDGAPVHTLVLFTEQRRLPQNAAGTVRYHRADGTEEHDSITAWSAVRVLERGSVSRLSWDYDDPLATPFMNASARSRQDQGQRGNRVAIDIDDYRIDPPHAGATNADHLDLTRARMASHDYAAKSFHGEGTVRDLRVGEWITLDGHPEVDRHDDDARQFIVTAFQLAARNNLPKALNGRIDRLFARNHWHVDRGAAPVDTDAQPFRIHFTCSRRSIRIVAPYDPRVDVPPARMLTAIVVGPDGETVHCDDLGRIKIRFPGTRAADHAHAAGAGASDTDADSAWVRVAMPWAGNGPVIVGQLYNQAGMPAALSSRGALPGNRYLAGLRSREVRGTRGNQLRLDDTPAQISAQLASDHGASELNLGWLSTPRADGSGEPRGEGAELRSDHAVAIRGGKGVLVSAQARADAAGGQLDRPELAKVFETLGKLSEQLSKLAVTHALDDAAGPDLAELIEDLKRLHGGSNVAPGSTGAAPIVAVSGPAGVVVGSNHNVAVGAQANIDLLSAGDTTAAAAGHILLRAALDISLFANELGLKLIAARGMVRVQAQGDAMELLAKKVLELISTTDWINIKARQGIRLYGGGSEVEISAAGILGYTNGKNHMFAADHQTLPPQERPLQFPDELPHHEICLPCVLKAAEGNSPFAEAT
jgi:type VI secretion system secreted protein VgrG